MVSTLSVVMPLRNEQKWVGAALQALLCQTFEDFEVVVVDDGSIDSSRAVVESFCDARIRLIAGPGIDLTAALNTGLAAANGEFIARMDSDDLCHPTRFEKQISYLRGNGNKVVVGSGFEIIDESSEVISRLMPPVTHEAIARRLLVRNPFAHGSLMFRRTSVLRYEESPVEDYRLLISLGKVGQYGTVPEFLYSWRRRDATLSTAPERVQQVARNFESVQRNLWSSDMAAPPGRAVLGCEDSSGRAVIVQTELLIAAKAVAWRRFDVARDAIAALSGYPFRAWVDCFVHAPDRFRSIQLFLRKRFRAWRFSRAR
jgi:glycosyltransferase involved in cell wall biosynthesis